jgi:hypothetical protein
MKNDTPYDKMTTTAFSTSDCEDHGGFVVHQHCNLIKALTTFLFIREIEEGLEACTYGCAIESHNVFFFWALKQNNA